MEIIAYTDGSFQKDPTSPYGSDGQRGYGGYGIYFPNKEFADISEPFLAPPITNQRAELFAIYTTFKMVTESKIDYDSLTIYTDSMYSINCFTQWAPKWIKNGWKGSNKKSVKNRDIIEKAYEYYEKDQGRINLIHVRGHQGNAGNERADQLANKGAMKMRLMIFDKQTGGVVKKHRKKRDKTEVNVQTKKRKRKAKLVIDLTSI